MQATGHGSLSPIAGRKLGRLVLPVTLAVSSFVVGGCGDDEDPEPSPDPLPDCADVVSATECTKCEDGGVTNCVGQASDPDALCFYDSTADACDEAIA